MPVLYDQTIKSPSLRPASPAASLRSPGALSPAGSAVPAEVSASVAGRDATLPAPRSGPLPVIDPAHAPRARGFAAMDKDRQRKIASAGGRAAHECGNAHEFTSEEARSAGRKGGMSISQNREHMAAIGSKGGLTRGERQRVRESSPM